MAVPLTGRPRLNIPLVDVLEAVRAHGNQYQAAADLGCSEGYVRKAIRMAGLNLDQVLTAVDLENLLADGRARGGP